MAVKEGEKRGSYTCPNKRIKEDTKKDIREIIREEWLIGEDWKYYNYGYYFSNMGRIYSIRSKAGRFLSNRMIYKHEYVKPTLVAWNKKKVNVLCHRIVAELFVYNPFPSIYNIVHHKNGNKQDNRASNLRWTTQEDNIKSYFNDTFYIRGIIEVNGVIDTGVSIIGTWSTITECSDDTGLSCAEIVDVANGHTNTGRIFKFIS